MEEAAGKKSKGGKPIAILVIVLLLAAVLLFPVIMWAALFRQGITSGLGWPADSTASGAGIIVGADCKVVTIKEGTTYFPGGNAWEGGVNQATGGPAHSIQDYLAGKYKSTPANNYVTLASDIGTWKDNTNQNHWKPKEKAYIPDLEKRIGQGEIVFRMGDSGGDFGHPAMINNPRSLTAKNHDRAYNGHLYIDLATNNKAYENSSAPAGQLDLRTTGLQMYVGEGCVRSGIGDAFASQGGSEIATKIAQTAAYYVNNPTIYNTCGISDRTACNQFAMKVMHKSGADAAYSGNALGQYNYVKSRPDCYAVSDITSTKDLVAGDLLFLVRGANQHGHVAVYVGNGKIAAASLNDHPPAIQSWYSDLDTAARIKGVPCPQK